MPITFRCCKALCWFELLDSQDDRPCWGVVFSRHLPLHLVHVCEGHELQFFGGPYIAEPPVDLFDI